MTDKADVVVVGGGIIGVCAAWELVERGADVLLLERDGIAAGASRGNAGWVFPSHSTPLPAPGVIRKALTWLFDPDSPFYIQPRWDPVLFRWLWAFRAACTEAQMRGTFALRRDLSLASIERFAELASEVPELQAVHFARRGLLAVCTTVAGLAAVGAELSLARELGDEGEMLDGAAVRQRVPALSADVIGGALQTADAHLDPGAFCEGLAAAAARRGARLRTDVAVERLEEGGRRLVTSAGEITCETLIVAGGAWSVGLLEPLGVRLPIQPAKGYSLTVPTPGAGVGEAPLLLAEAKVGVTPLGDRLRFAGTLELAGLDLSIKTRRVEAIRRAAETFLPGLGAVPDVTPWRGLRPLTPDDRMILGRPAAAPTVIVATGHGMSGISHGPVTGLLAAQIATGEDLACDVAPFDPDRFA